MAQAWLLYKQKCKTLVSGREHPIWVRLGPWWTFLERPENLLPIVVDDLHGGGDPGPFSQTV